MEWVDRILSATGWDGMPGRLDWAGVESAVGTPLPEDFKGLCRYFSGGSFDDHLVLLEPEGESESMAGNHEGLLASVRGNPENRSVYRPYGLFGDSGAGSGAGLLQWGFSYIEDEYYWLADARTDPADWPVIAREDPLEGFHRFDMPASEFLHSVLTDPGFRPFTIAHKIDRPFYRSW
ncbi:SMI1/KNR4 family protein [Streptomyces sp. NPDC015032]|uniref:SMI1/KNR4 family protein n=1 Tax=Streptomyces sp. NPDC015032 TaxID=3364937 RepID=UPI0036F77DC5